MPIDIKRLDEIYNTSIDSPENKGWIAIPDSKKVALIANATGSSGGNPGNGWKIHISIDPNKMSQAAQLIAQELNSEKAPRVSVKFAGKQLANTGQPSKQVAFIFYEEELGNKEKIAEFLNRIEFLLRSNEIGIDPRPINSDIEATKTKYDAIITDDQIKPTRFNYRNEQCIVMEDNLYNDVGGVGDTFVQGEQIWVKQSYYVKLPNSQKHNPGNRVVDPLAEIQIKSSNKVDSQAAEKTQYGKFRAAVLKGDRDLAESLLAKAPEKQDFLKKSSVLEATARAGQLEMLQWLSTCYTPEALQTTLEDENFAVFSAGVSSGRKEILEFLFKLCPDAQKENMLKSTGKDKPPTYQAEEVSHLEPAQASVPKEVAQVADATLSNELTQLRELAEQDNLTAIIRLGTAYFKGENGTEQSYTEAFKFFEEAAKKRDAYSQCMLGFMYLNGLGVQKNNEEAVSWYRKAAEGGYAEAQTNLGIMYRNGYGVPKNDAEAVRLYKLAANQSDKIAQYHLGFMHVNGLGNLKKDEMEALKCYRASAEQGYAVAQYNLGVMFENGIGVQKNTEEAQSWYNKANQKGSQAEEVLALRSIVSEIIHNIKGGKGSKSRFRFTHSQSGTKVKLLEGFERYL